MTELQRLIKVLVCTAFLSLCLSCSTTQKHETAGQYLDDSIVTTKVKAALFDEMALRTFKINVSTHQGVVLLTGSVDTQEHADRAAEVARRVEGVTDVENDLNVK